MVEARVAFWSRYRPYISHAWLVVVPNTQFEIRAKALFGDSFGRFQFGDVDNDHLGLVMQIGSLNILEMNKDGSTCFWPAGDLQITRNSNFYSDYSRGHLRAICPETNAADATRFRRRHNGGWQDRYQTAIWERTHAYP